MTLSNTMQDELGVLNQSNWLRASGLARSENSYLVLQVLTLA
jgi:hypothetical protein